jgi:hypothetical protein
MNKPDEFDEYYGAFYTLEYNWDKSMEPTYHKTQGDAINLLACYGKYLTGTITEYEVSHERYCMPSAMRRHDVKVIECDWEDDVVDKNDHIYYEASNSHRSDQ